MSIRILYLCFNMCVVATEVEYSTPDQFGILELSDMQVSMSV